MHLTFDVTGSPLLCINPLLLATEVPPIPAAHRWAASYDGRHGPLIDLAQAIPGSPPPAAMLERLAVAAGLPQTSNYGPIAGDPPLVDALAADIRGLYRGDVRPDEIAITAGCNQAFFVAMVALARAGDEVIVPVPWYFNHKMTLDMLGIVTKTLPCEAANGFVPDPEAARKLIGPTTRAIVLVTPNNPTGAVYPAEVLREFQSLAREAGIALVIDETYRDFLPVGIARPHELFADPDWRASTVQLYSFSKSYAIPGHRLGAMVAGDDLMQQIVKVLDCMQICAPRAAQIAAAWAIEGTRGWRTQVRATINQRAALFREAIAQSPGWSISASGAYFAYVRHPFGLGEPAPAERLSLSAGILALPDSFFGPDQGGHMRMAFPNVSEAILATLAERLKVLG